VALLQDCIIFGLEDWKSENGNNLLWSLRLWPLLLFGCSFAAIPHYFGIGRLEI
jgi:hypothetical protein